MTKYAHRYPRGRYPARVLSKVRSRSLIDGQTGYVKVNKFVAAAWNAMVAEIHRERGVMIYASGPAGGYRSLSFERWMHTHFRWLWPVLAAVGYSNHNEADCIDRYSWSGLPRAYVDAKLRRFGFTRTIASEEWHLQHDRSDRWYVAAEKAPITDTRKVYYALDVKRYYLAGLYGGKSFLRGTRNRRWRDRWKAKWGMGTPYHLNLDQIRTKAGLS